MELGTLHQIPENTDAIEWESHRLINLERDKAGLQPLKWDSRLAEIARAHSKDMAENYFFSHDNLKGQDSTDRGQMAGYPCRKTFSYGLGENILQGHQGRDVIKLVKAWWNNQSANDLAQIEEAKSAVQRWMDSPGHRENILEYSYDRAGIGVAFNGGTYYLTQNFC